MALRVTLVQGGGIGLDQVPAVKHVLQAAGVAVEWDEHLAGLASLQQGGTPLPEGLLRSVRSTGLALKTKLLMPDGPQAGNYNVAFRRELGLFASVRPLKNLRELIVDNCCMQMVSRPHQFDVLVMGNLYGDLVSDLGAGVVGGISATAGINVGDGVRVYESFHGGSREAIGVDRANPLPLLLPAIDLLKAVGQAGAARRILAAVETVLTAGVV